MMNQVKDLKRKQATELANTVDMRVKTLLLTDAVRGIKAEIESFLENPYNDTYYMDECSMLCSYIDIDLGELAEEEMETIDAVLDEISDGIGCFQQDQYAQGPRDYQYHQCLGEPVIFNESPERNHYAIYSNELGLKVNSVINEEHGFLIIEKAMRQHGVFENIVSTDYYGNPTLLSNPFSALTDAELMVKIDDAGGE